MKHYITINNDWFEETVEKELSLIPNVNKELAREKPEHMQLICESVKRKTGFTMAEVEMQVNKLLKTEI